MEKKNKKIITMAMSLALALALIAGGAEVVGMLGGPAVAAPVLASGGSDGGSPSYDPGPSAPSTPSTPSTPSKKANPVKASGKTIQVDGAKVAKKKVVIKKAKAFSISNSQGSVRFLKKSGNKKISVDKKSGNITVKKGLKPGKYKVKVAVSALGNSSYKSAVRKVTVTIKVTTISNTMTVSGNTIDVTSEEITAADKVIKRADAIFVSKAKGKLTFTKKSGSESILINKKTGDVTIKQGLAAGTYNVKVSVTAAGSKKYKKLTKSATVTVIVAPPVTPAAPEAAQGGASDGSQAG